MEYSSNMEDPDRASSMIDELLMRLLGYWC